MDLNVSLTGAIVILASDCQNFKSQLSIRVLVTPSETLQTMDYIEQEIVRDISQQVSVKCSDGKLRRTDINFLNVQINYVTSTRIQDIFWNIRIELTFSDNKNY